MNQCVPRQRQWGGRRWRRRRSSPHICASGSDCSPPLPPHAPAFRLPVQGQPPSDVTTAVTPTTPPLLPTGVGHALFFSMDAAARATAEAQVAAAMAKQAAATMQTAMAALAAAYVGQPVAVVSPPAADVSPWQPSALDGPPARAGPRAPSSAPAGAGLQVPPSTGSGVAPAPPSPLLSALGPPAGAKPRGTLYSCRGGAASCFTPSITARSPGSNGLLIGFTRGSAGTTAASGAASRLASQRRYCCSCARGRAPSINASGSHIIFRQAGATFIAPTPC